MLKIKKVWKKLSLVSIQKAQNHNIQWKDVDKQIFDEDSIKVFEVRVFGVKVWRIENVVVANHEILKAGKKVGFVTDDKSSEQTGVVNKATIQGVQNRL